MSLSHLLLFLFALAFSSSCYSSDKLNSPDTPSQKRESDETYDEAVQKYLDSLAMQGTPIQPFARTALNVAVTLDHLDISNAPKWDNLGADFKIVQEGFELGRDSRYLSLPEGPSFPRRPSWLYPDDGCFARAALTGQKLESLNYPRPYKLFVFGNLAVNTVNHPKGRVYWWYHVVPAISWGETLYVIDPAIETSGPLLWTEWISRMTLNAETIKTSLCNPYAYDPGSLCYESSPSSEFYALNHQFYYLRLEWQRLLNLRRDPTLELGEDPPWLYLTQGLSTD